MLQPPLRHRIEDRSEVYAYLREAVVCVWRHYLMHAALHQAVGLQLFELLYEHFLRDRRYRAAQLAIALRTRHEVVENDRLPSAAYAVQCVGHRALI